MAFFALADLHLGFAVDKPMDVFGPQWENHAAKIAAKWAEVVAADDVVLLPGDTSWAMRLSEVQPDLAFIADLPGRKILLRGNHDYWWNSINKVRAVLPPGMSAIQNDHLMVNGWAVCGARGWNIPNSGLPGEDDPKIFLRERNRLEMSLNSAPPGAPKVVMMHFPPALAVGDEPGFVDLLERHDVVLCVYGHLHGTRDHALGLQGVRNGVRYVLCAADAVDFTPVRLPLESIASGGQSDILNKTS
ncbi:MAG: metallophosphoesterase [Candidatus Lernaella stagnicola]|nr:metallophosphoesterase [Candidatus Lernaella stagnicola]